MQIIDRATWGARYEDGFRPAPTPAVNVWLHHSATVAPDLAPPFADDHDAVRYLEQIGETRFGAGISYTFVITPAGLIFEGHSVDREGAHTAGRNSADRAICWVGNYDLDQPAPAMLEATADLLAYGYARGWWASPYLAGGHRDAPGAATACPGRYGAAAVDNINDKVRRLLEVAGATEREDDVMAALTPEDHDAIAQRVVAYLVDPRTGRGKFNLQAIYNKVTATDRRVDTMDDHALAALERIEHALENRA